MYVQSLEAQRHLGISAFMQETLGPFHQYVLARCTNDCLSLQRESNYSLYNRCTYITGLDSMNVDSMNSASKTEAVFSVPHTEILCFLCHLQTKRWCEVHPLDRDFFLKKSLGIIQLIKILILVRGYEDSSQPVTQWSRTAWLLSRL